LRRLRQSVVAKQRISAHLDTWKIFRVNSRFIFSKPVTCSPSNQSLLGLQKGKKFFIPFAITAGQTLKAFRKDVYFC